MTRSVIIGTGSFIPEVVVNNSAFANRQFFEADGTKMYKSNKAIIEKFESITGIYERRYATQEQHASDLAFAASTQAIESAGIDKETLDYIILAHNFGDVAYQSNRVSMVPSLASRVKARLQINNPDCVAYDIGFGCPGWIEGMIQANSFIRSGDARRCLVIGTETLSRVIDEHDRDSMIYSDGSGAAIIEASQDAEQGIRSYKTETHAVNDYALLKMEKSYSSFTDAKDDLYLKMSGRKVYEFALSHVPRVIAKAIEKAGLKLTDIKKVLVHQANDKMDCAILERLFKLCKVDVIPEGIMPMTIGWLGNSSVATVPTLLDLLLRSQLEGHKVEKGDNIVMASVGAGMNINAMVYQF
jgi:3-oxoacyl-[acyl-carrier-protein] synthase III